MTIDDQAALFHLWDASQGGTPILSFDVTRAGLPRLGLPDPAWLSAACRTLGAPARASDCRVLPVRSSYYADHPDEHEPRDRWPDCWAVEATLTAGSAVRAHRDAPRLGLSVPDPSWNGTRDPAHDERALIIAVGDATGAQKALGDAVAAAHNEGLRPTATAVVAAADGRAVIRVLTPCAFLRDVGGLEAITSRLRASGWATDWRSALS